MADLQSDKVKEDRLLQRAIWTKWNRFTWSGLLFVAIGLVIIVLGLLLQTDPYLVAGLGVIVVIVGVIRLLIGIINPLSPDDLREERLPSEGSEIENE